MDSARPTSTLLLLGVLACSPSCTPTDGDTSFSSGSASQPGIPGTTAPGGVSATDVSTGEASFGSASGPLWDMGLAPDFSLEPPGCKGKIDFLFIISRTGFMKFHQDQLVAAFPHFIATIQDQFSDFDVQIMVTDTHEEWGATPCEKQCPFVCNEEPDYPCDYKPTSCDKTMGAGVVINIGPYTANKLCLTGPLRYIKGDTPNLLDTFSCLARVGAGGHNMIGDAIMGAMNPKLNAPGGCNAGFLRDDALLMITIIGEEDNASPPANSSGTWKEWKQAILAAKGGDIDKIVMFGLVGGAACPGTLDPDFRVCRMIPTFRHHILKSLTTPDYGPAFDEAAALALNVCSTFVPG